MVSVLLTYLALMNEYLNMVDKLFNCITSDEHHVLHQLLPPI